LNVGGPTTPEGVILEELRREARRELAPKADLRDPFDIDLSGTHKLEEDIEALAQRRLKKAMAEAGLA
jgi:predicted nuclease of restriction endonuclease-like (RecB) superfamily